MRTLHSTASGLLEPRPHRLQLAGRTRRRRHPGVRRGDPAQRRRLRRAVAARAAAKAARPSARIGNAGGGRRLPPMRFSTVRADQTERSDGLHTAQRGSGNAGGGRRLPPHACSTVRAARLNEVKDGGPDRDRTGDLLNAIQARSQLRHRPTRAFAELLIVPQGGLAGSIDGRLQPRRQTPGVL